MYFPPETLNQNGFAWVAPPAGCAGSSHVESSPSCFLVLPRLHLLRATRDRRQILSQLSKSDDGSYAYSLPSVVLLAEFTKLWISLGFLTVDKGSVTEALSDVTGTSVKSWLVFALPSVLYSLNNNLDMLNNQHMDPATEQVLVQEMGFGAKAAAVVDTQRHQALCQLAADPESGDMLRSHIMHTWCAEVAAGMGACPACFEDATESEIQPKTRIRRIGFDIGGVIVPHREDREDAEDIAGLTREDYLQVEAGPGALENVYIISKCGPETEARTREWMEHSGFFERTGIQRKNVHFCRDVKDKAPIVAKLELDGFVDDRIDVLRPMLSLPRVRPLLFMLNPEVSQDVLGLSPVFWIPRMEKLHLGVGQSTNEARNALPKTSAKILTTGVVWWWVFGREMGVRKWCGLLLLFVGAVSAGWPQEAPAEGKRMHIDSFGVFLILIYVWVSASAGVYNEWLYKNFSKDENIHSCNVRLYIIGCAVNLSAHLSREPSVAGLQSLFTGYNRYCWGLVATYSFMGLLIAQVMKYLDSIVKLYISGCSMYVSAALSWIIFGYLPTTNFVMGMILVTIAMVIYNLEQLLPKGKKQ
eukprot:s309_g8.t4